MMEAGLLVHGEEIAVPTTASVTASCFRSMIREAASSPSAGGR